MVFNYTGAAASHLWVGDGAETLVAPVIFLGLTAASWALRPPERRDFQRAAGGVTGGRMIAFWIATVAVAGELAVGGAWELLRTDYVRDVVEHLGAGGCQEVGGVHPVVVTGRHPPARGFLDVVAPFTLPQAIHRAGGPTAGRLLGVVAMPNRGVTIRRVPFGNRWLNMSLLRRGTHDVVYPEEVTVDADGITRTRPSIVGVPARAVIQPLTSTEDAAVGDETESKYRMRLIGWPEPLGAQAQVEWRGKRFGVDPKVYNGSRRTAHVDYVLIRK